MGEERIAGDVEGNAEEDVCAALVELTVQATIHHLELEKCVTGRQRHVIDHRCVPGADDMTARIGVAGDLVDDEGELIDLSAIGALPAAPLGSVDGTEFSGFGVRPFIPDRDPCLLERPDVALPADEPEKFSNHRFQVNFLGGQERKPGAEIEPDLAAEEGASAGSGAIGLRDAILENVPQQFEVGLHRASAGQGTAPSFADRPGRFQRPSGIVRRAAASTLGCR